MELTIEYILENNLILEINDGKYTVIEGDENESCE